MRALVSIALALALASPAAMAAEHHGARAAPSRGSAKRSGGRAVAARPRATAPGAHTAVPAPQYRPRYAPYAYPYPYGYPRYYFDPFYYAFAPPWWGWGWGFGYYPLYPRPRYGYAPEQVSRITTRLMVEGGGTLRRGGGAAGLALGIEGERLGFHVGLDGFSPPGARSAFDSSTIYGYATAHLTASLLSTDVARLRVELGGSMLSWPDVGPDAGATSFGPDVGVSGQLGLLGPVGVEGYARLTPIPTPIFDWQAALAFRFGPAALTAGWRELSVYKGSSSTNRSRFDFSGPQAGLGFQF
ncbi:MAG TPA: hypothetical protein VF904_14140 [Anaeromyxobacteraceae bacterium]